MSAHNNVMKDSGIPWIGLIPESWGLTKVSNQYDVTLGKMLCTSPETSDSTEENYLCSANVKRNGIEGDIKAMWFTPKEKEEYLLKEGDLIVSEGGNAGTPMIYDGSRDPCYIQNAVHRVRAYDNQDIRNRFLYYWMSFAKDIGYVDQVCNKATIAHFTKKKLMEMPVVSIDLDTMSDIVHYLDTKCSQIDDIIRQNSLIVDKLSNLKQSIISEAVTKGLDSNVILKESGVDWIGVIPESWGLTKVSNQYDVTLGKMLCTSPETSDSTEENYLCSANVKRNGIEGDIKAMWFTPKEKEEYLLKEGDLIVSEGGNAGTPMIYDGSRDPCYIQNAVHRVRAYDNQDIRNRFLYYWMSFAKDIGYVDQVCNKATIAHFTKKKLMEMPVVSIDLDTMSDIVNQLDSKCTQMDLAINYSNDLIDSMYEYKQSLIYEYVTGKKSINTEVSS